MRLKAMVLASFVAVCGVVYAADKTEVKSGPQVGEAVPGPFSPLNINGEEAGNNSCLFCRNGNNPVVMIFARQADDATCKLIKTVEKATAANKDAKLGSFVVFCSDDKALEAKLKEVCKAEKLENCVLSIDTPEGPAKYDVAKDADVTVVLYNKRKVVANHAFKKGELSEEEITKVMAELPKITK